VHSPGQCFVGQNFGNSRTPNAIKKDMREIKNKRFARVKNG
jgi:hypothetical protein